MEDLTNYNTGVAFFFFFFIIYSNIYLLIHIFLMKSFVDVKPSK